MVRSNLNYGPRCSHCHLIVVVKDLQQEHHREGVHSNQYFHQRWYDYHVFCLVLYTSVVVDKGYDKLAISSLHQHQLLLYLHHLLIMVALFCKKQVPSLYVPPE